jgi:iron only hydrogenase large subunit-like protein
MNKVYRHSVFLQPEKCTGCVNCIKHCPTEAIRVRQGKAVIAEERCIDCGGCIRICPNTAKAVVTDGLAAPERFPWRIALVPPSFYAQFKGRANMAEIHGALRQAGFDDCFDVALAAEIVSEETKKLLPAKKTDSPLLSSACPAVVRLIQVKFPSLLPQVLPLEAPVTLAGRLAKMYACRQFGYRPEEVGTFFLSPCSAKVSAIKNAQDNGDCYNVDGAIPVTEVFAKISTLPAKRQETPVAFVPSIRGLRWGMAGGEWASVNAEHYLVVDGIHNVTKVLDEVEMNRLEGIDFIELQACDGGCLGGYLNVRNRFEARVRLRKTLKAYEEPRNLAERLAPFGGIDLSIRPLDLPPYIRTSAFAHRLDEAIKVMKRYDQILEQLPGLDCGSCGSPSCKTLAEDVALGLAQEMDCVFRLREKIASLADEVLLLSKTMPPSLTRVTQEKAKEGSDDGCS